ncbi:MAG TPA: hypothetical protein VEU47_14015 [Candidatus Cybelea sp.]|nr:hypothetical protein [Candidatus Cybelea sp.]
MARQRNLFGTEAAVRSRAARTVLRLFDSLYEVAVDRNARIVWMNSKYKALLGWNATGTLKGARK